MSVLTLCPSQTNMSTVERTVYRIYFSLSYLLSQSWCNMWTMFNSACVSTSWSCQNQYQTGPIYMCVALWWTNALDIHIIVRCHCDIIDDALGMAYSHEIPVVLDLGIKTNKKTKWPDISLDFLFVFHHLPDKVWADGCTGKVGWGDGDRMGAELDGRCQ